MIRPHSKHDDGNARYYNNFSDGVPYCCADDGLECDRIDEPCTKCGWTTSSDDPLHISYPVAQHGFLDWLRVIRPRDTN